MTNLSHSSSFSVTSSSFNLVAAIAVVNVTDGARMSQSSPTHCCRIFSLPLKDEGGWAEGFFFKTSLENYHYHFEKLLSDSVRVSVSLTVTELLRDLSDDLICVDLYEYIAACIYDNTIVIDCHRKSSVYLLSLSTAHF